MKWIFDPKNLQGIIDVLLSMVSSSATGNSLVFTATSVPDGVEVSDLLTATDFALGTGTVDSLTAVGNTYTAVTSGTAAGSTTFGLINQPSMTVKGFETESDVDITIGA